MWLELWCLFSVCLAIDDPWGILGVSRSATNKEIKSAYKRLAKEWHPDVNKSPEAEERFVDIAEAYQILTDEEKKREWQRTREGGFGSGFRRKSSSFGFSADDLFKQFFGSSNFGEEGITTRDFFNFIISRTNRSPHVFLFVSPWCFECQQAKKYFTVIENEFKKYGYGTGKVNANVQPKLTEFMNVKRVPSLVVVFKEEPYLYTTSELYSGDTIGLRKFCESLATSAMSVPLLKTEVEVSDFIRSYEKTLRLRVLLITDKDALSTAFITAASQFRGEIDFAFSKFENDELNDLRLKFKISTTSLLVFGSSFDTPVYQIPTTQFHRSTFYAKLKSLRFAPVTRISHQQQFDDRCPITYEERQPLCLVFVHFGPVDSSDLRDFLTWGAKNAAEMDSEAKLVVIKGEEQDEFVKSLGALGGISKSTVFLIQRYAKSAQVVEVPITSGFIGFTAAAWKAIFSKEEFRRTDLGLLRDESEQSDVIGSLRRKVWRFWRRFRHLEEEELLIFIAVPLAILMFSATFLVAGNQEEATKRRPGAPNRRVRESTPEIPVRHLKKLNASEIANMVNEQVRFLVVLLVKDSSASEAERDIMIEMTRQYAIKAQELRFDAHKPDFFVCHMNQTDQSVAPDIELCPGTVLAVNPQWWSAYQLDADDDIYMDNILPHFEHWLARLQDGAVKKYRYA